MIQAIEKETTLSISGKPKDVIFTGHSAGAAVAQILFGFACSPVRTTALSQAVAGGRIFHFVSFTLSTCN